MLLIFFFQVNEDDLGPNLTPDDDIFTHLAASYVETHGTMKNKTNCYRFGLWTLLGSV